MASVYTQQGKRQKVRDGRSDNVDYFQGIDKVEYNNTAPATDSLSYRYFNSGERVQSRPMEDWMKCSVSLTEFRSHGHDHYKRPWEDNTRSLDNYKRCIKALYDFCVKLGVKYWTAFDTDLVPLGDSWEENRAAWDEIVEYIQDLNQRYHLKVMWIAPDLHSNPRYTSGAITSNDAITFVQAASQIKKCLEVSQKLNAECFLLWPHQEGYHALLQTDLNREIKLMAKLLKITAEYKERINYRCQLLIMPYYNSEYYMNLNDFSYGNYMNYRGNETVNTYIWDVTSCLYFLKSYNLDRYYKVCTAPGHHMYMANVYNMLGGIAITNYFNQYDSKTLTLMMKCIIDQGTVPAGGINLKLPARRDCDPREMVVCYVRYIDGIAKGLRAACSITTEQLFSKQLQQRYLTYCTGFGSRLMNNDVSLEECEEYYKKNQAHSEVGSKTEHFETVFQRYVDACDRA